jgi:integrase
MSVPDPVSYNLADVIARVLEADDLTDLQKRDQASAVRKAARLIGAAPAELSAEPLMLRRALERVAPEAHGVSRARWNNIRSLVGKALTRCRPIHSSRNPAPLLPEWEMLVAKLPNRRPPLVAMLRYLSARGIDPAAVAHGDHMAYHDAIHHDRLRKNPELTWKTVAKLWNTSVRDTPGWPQLTIERKSRLQTYTMPWTTFPPSLVADKDAYLHRLSGADLSEDGPDKPLRPISLKMRDRQLRMAASALVLKGVDAAELRRLADLVTLDRFKLALQFFYDRKGGKPSPQLGNLAVSLKALASDWVRVDDVELLKMKKIVGKVTGERRRGMTVKNRERLRPLDDPKTVKAFLALPRRIRAEVEKDKRAPRRRAIKAQMAAAIAILQAAPIRIANLARIDLRRHLIPHSDRVYLVINEAETKNGEPIDVELPRSAVEIIAWYARDYRPLLVKGPSDFLFPGEGAESKKIGWLGEQIGATVHRYTGLAWNPHLFRHAAGKIYLDQRPGEYEVVRRVLGHKSISTTVASYTGAETRAAGTHFASVVDNLRGAGPSRPSRRRNALLIGGSR